MEWLVYLLAMLFGNRVDATTYEISTEIVSECYDDMPVSYIDTDKWVLYGDQDGNARIDGDDCNWR